MSEKIAVHCPTEELWNKVRKVIDPYQKRGYSWSVWTTDSCFKIHAQKNANKGICRNEGYTIISAEEYLKEVKDEVMEQREFKVGDRVEILQGYNIPDLAWIKAMDEHVGTIAIINSIAGNGFIGFKYLPCAYDKSWLKLLTNKPTTTKEETMSISINETVAKVFPKSIEDAKLVTKYFGSEYAEGNFRGFIFLRDNAVEVLREAKDRQKEDDAKK
jgi:hypothetical protein